MNNNQSDLSDVYRVWIAALPESHVAALRAAVLGEGTEDGIAKGDESRMLQRDIEDNVERLRNTEPTAIHVELAETARAFVLAEELKIRSKMLRMLADEAKLAGAKEEEVGGLVEEAERCRTGMEEQWKSIRDNITAEVERVSEKLGLNGEATRRLNALRRNREREEEDAYRAERDLCRRCKKGEVRTARPGRKTCAECGAVDAANRAKRNERKRRTAEAQTSADANPAGHTQ